MNFPDPQRESVPMACEDVLDLLHALINNDLEDDDAEAMFGHLADCKPCREALAQHVRLNGMLQSNLPWLGKFYLSKYQAPYH